MTSSATDIHAKIQQAADVAPTKTRDCMSIKLGQWARQGDVMITRIAAVPAAWDVPATEHRQVAVGDTIGSRHIAEGPAIKVMWPKSKADAVKQCPIKGFAKALGSGAEFCLGPVIVAEQPWTLTHPEHSHHEFPAGIYLATYQLDRATMRQVRD